MSLRAKTRDTWKCSGCRKCDGCGSSIVSSGHGDTCQACCQARAKGGYCPVCRGCYQEDDYDLAMMECSKCGGWIHAQCEGLDGEDYQVLSYLPDSVSYICKCPSPAPLGSNSKCQSQRESKKADVKDGDVLVPDVPALVPVPGHVTNSPLRDNMLHSLNNATPTVPDGISYDLDKTLATISLEIPPISSESSFYAFNDTNVNVSSSEISYQCETSPKPSEAIDDEYDYVTLDSSAYALPSSFDTS